MTATASNLPQPEALWPLGMTLAPAAPGTGPVKTTPLVTVRSCLYNAEMVKPALNRHLVMACSHDCTISMPKLVSNKRRALAWVQGCQLSSK